MEVGNLPDYKMHCDVDVEDSASMQGKSRIKTLQLMLIVDCLASAGQ